MEILIVIVNKISQAQKYKYRMVLLTFESKNLSVDSSGYHTLGRIQRLMCEEGVNILSYI